jgi:predicted TIM-barrel fold metal-dependent hydrolase
MTLDGHIHVAYGPADPDGLVSRIQLAGIEGGMLISAAPPCFAHGPRSASAADRLDNLLAWSGAWSSLFPCYWIDPLERGAVDQVAMAVERGISAFKVICDRYHAGDKRAMQVFRAIAHAGKPILFHSGILWDGKPSSRYNRPAEFEALLDIDGLKFSLAHISWPWCDELIAVYGKFLNAYTRRPELSVEMFIDTTPGTPPIYRREALTKLLGVGYDIEHNVVFGTDCSANDYNVEWAKDWIQRDREVLSELGLDEEALGLMYGRNLQRFLGLSDEIVEKRPLRPGE